MTEKPAGEFYPGSRAEEKRHKAGGRLRHQGAFTAADTAETLASAELTFF